MKSGNSNTLFGWTCAIAAVVLSGFLLGYWSGHRQIMPWDRTMEALAMLPLLWLGSPGMILTYLWTAIAWYAPIHHEFLCLPAAVMTFAFWFISIQALAQAAAGSKFIRF